MGCSLLLPLPLHVLDPPPAEQRAARIVRRLRRVGPRPAGNLRQIRQPQPPPHILPRRSPRRQPLSPALGLGDLELLAGAAVAFLRHLRQALRPSLAALAPP